MLNRPAIFRKDTFERKGHRLSRNLGGRAAGVFPPGECQITIAPTSGATIIKGSLKKELMTNVTHFELLLLLMAAITGLELLARWMDLPARRPLLSSAALACL
jgi:hypothetical protein